MGGANRNRLGGPGIRKIPDCIRISQFSVPWGSVAVRGVPGDVLKGRPSTPNVGIITGIYETAAGGRRRQKIERAGQKSEQKPDFMCIS